jgi:hypothetical protein
MVNVNHKNFNWKYVEPLPCKPGNDDVLSPEVTGGSEMSTYTKPKEETVNSNKK